MAMEYFQGGIEVELTSHEGPIVSRARTMPQDYEYRGMRDHESSPRRNSMHQARRSYDSNLSTTIPVKKLLSFNGLDSESMVGTNANTDGAPPVWDAPPAKTEDWDATPAPISGIEKENESSRYLRSYERRPAPSPFSSMRSLRSRDDKDDRSVYSHIELDDDASDISSSAMGSLRRRNRISQIHAEKLLLRQQRENLEKKKKPLRSKTSINEVKPKTSSTLKPAPKNVSSGAKSQESKAFSSLPVENKVCKVVPKTATLLKDADSSSSSTEEKTNGPLTAKSTTSFVDDPSDSGFITSSANSTSPDRSEATNWTSLTYSTGGSGGRVVYRTQIICSGKYKGRVMDKVVTIHPDELQIGRILEGLEHGFVDREDFAHILITALFDSDIKKEPLYKLKQWEKANSTLSRLEKEQEQENPPKASGKAKEEDVSSDAATAFTAPTVSTEESRNEEQSGNGDKADSVSPPPETKPVESTSSANVANKPPLSPKESGDVQFVAEKTASLQYKDVFGMASAKGIIHFYEGKDEIWIEDYNFCFASRRFKFLSG